MVIAASLTVPLYAQALWVGPVGGGMLSVPEATVLEPGHGSIGLVLDNYDRDPLGIDIFDARVDWCLGVIHRLEIFGRYQISRAVSEPGAVPVPSPPLDIVVRDGSPIPRAPYRAMYWPMPYLSHHPSSLIEMTPGEYIFGMKVLVRHQHGRTPALAASISASIPDGASAYDLSKGSGSNSVDITGMGTATWAIGSRLRLSSALGLTRNGALKRSDRIITQDPVGIIEQRITRPAMLSAGIGARLRLTSWASLLGEYSGWAPLGTATPQYDAAGASDVLAGMEFRHRALGLTLGFRQHLNPPRNGMTLPTGPLAGTLDISSLSPEAQRQYLVGIGVDPSLHRPNTSLVVLGTDPVNDPLDSHRVAPTYRTHTTGNDGVIAALSISF